MQTIKRDNSIINANSFYYNPLQMNWVASGKTNSQTVLEDSTKVAIWADYQQYDKKSNTLMTSGNVKIAYKNYIASGPKATFLPDKEGDSKPNHIVFYGRSKNPRRYKNY